MFAKTLSLFAFSVAILTLTILATILSVIVFGGIGLDFGGETNLEDGTYSEFLSSSVYSTIDPEGAAHIFYRCISGRDSSNEWWRFKITKENFKLLLNKIKFNRIDEVPITATIGNSSMPANWMSDGPRPSWWNISDASKKCELTTWKTLMSKKSRRTYRWYFLYDDSIETAWVWQSDHQYEW